MKEKDKVNKSIRLLEGKVADVLNERELVINIGSEKGVKLDMKFEVLEKEFYKIKDPDTGKLLDTLDKTKIRVKIVEVREKISIGRTYETYEVNVGGISSQSPSTGEIRVMTINTGRESLSSILNSPAFGIFGKQSIDVKIGDIVKQIKESVF